MKLLVSPAIKTGLAPSAFTVRVVSGSNKGTPLVSSLSVVFARPMRNALYLAQHETDKSVALAPNAVHDLAAIDPDAAFEMHAEGRRLFNGMRRLGGSDQQFARHAADARAGGAMGAAFDNRCSGACRPGCAISGESRGAGTDDRNVNLHGRSAARYRCRKPRAACSR